MSLLHEPFDLDYLHIALVDVHDGNQGVDERDLEANSVAFDHQSVLSDTVFDSYDGSATRTDVEADETLRPELVLRQLPFGDSKDLVASNLLGGLSRRHVLEGDLVAFCSTPDGADGEGSL